MIVPGRASAPISLGGKSIRSATPYAFGGGSVYTLPPSSFFSGRSVGGGNRTVVYGSRCNFLSLVDYYMGILCLTHTSINRTYGSGYPGVTGCGVSGRGFPFYFWPVAWGGAVALGTVAAYLHIDECGMPDNTSQPGGALVVAEFLSSLTAQNTSAFFRLLADNAAVTALVPDIIDACVPNANLGNANSVHVVNYTGFGADDLLTAPKPEQAVQYYRASSVALTYNGYNNTAVLMPEGTTDAPLPDDVDLTLLGCLNDTIGQVVSLVDGSSVSGVAAWPMGLVGLAYLVCIALVVLC